ncbi:MAG: glycosyltransferase family 4 protein, partial [Candidatus Thorarchaeota archaeon]
VETHSDYSHFVGYALHLLGFGWIADIWDNPEIYFESHPVFASIQLAFLKRKLRTAELVICVTHPDVLSDYGIDSERMLTQINGVNLPSEDDIKNKDLSSSHPKKRIVYVGWVTFSRGIDILLRAISVVVERIPDVELVLVGPSWDEREKVEALIDALRIESNVFQTGEVQHSEALELIRSSSIGVYPFPRTRFLDNVYPVKVPEYLSYGKPVVSSNLKGVRRYIDHGSNGLLFEPGDYSEFASMLIELLEDSKLLTQMSSEARRSSYKFQWSKINAESLQATLELVTRRAG